MTFTGQWAVITGAGGGIGRAVALGLAQQGANLHLVGRRPGPLAETAVAVQTYGVNVHCHDADLADEASLRGLSRALAGLAAVDVLVHSAGVFAQNPIATAPLEVLDQQYRVNVRAPYALTQALLPHLEASRGQVVFVNSTAGLTARAQVAAYAASKHALKAVADSLREEINAEGVRVLSVYPGRTASAMQAQVHTLEGRAYHPENLMQPEDVAAVIIHALGLPRTAEVTDVHMRPFQKA